MARGMLASMLDGFKMDRYMWGIPSDGSLSKTKENF